MKSDLPNASQFSPTQTPLPELLSIVERYELDRNKVSQEILHHSLPTASANASRSSSVLNRCVLART